MSDTARYIESVVLEVVRRLGLLTEAASESVGRAPDNAAAAKQPLVVTARLITLATLAGKLDNVRRLVVVPNAVVTPAVKDELRRRGIAVESRPPDAVPVHAHPVFVIRHAVAPEAVRAASALTGASDPSGPTFADLQGAVCHVAQAVTDPQRVAILLTDDRLAALCLANRHAAVRAAAARSADCVRAAVQEIGANVLVVDPRAVAPGDWSDMLNLFGCGLPRRCPPRLSP
ncbi:MAG: hypothetical protein FJ276_30175 [Planctomycetes bacterium]|nr:hypothetical protein [Planctomycetota bacterium]